MRSSLFLEYSTNQPIDSIGRFPAEPPHHPPTFDRVISPLMTRIMSNFDWRYFRMKYDFLHCTTLMRLFFQTVLTQLSSRMRECFTFRSRFTFHSLARASLKFARVAARLVAFLRRYSICGGVDKSTFIEVATVPRKV